MNKVCALLTLPLLPIAIVIDLVIGDFVTGVPTSAANKLRQHKKVWLDQWRKAGRLQACQAATPVHSRLRVLRYQMGADCGRGRKGRNHAAIQSKATPDEVGPRH